MMSDWVLVPEQCETHRIVFRQELEGIDVSVDWDGCTDWTHEPDKAIGHFCDLSQLASELLALHIIGAQYFCDDGKDAAFSICCLEQSEVPAAIWNAGERLRLRSLLS